MSLKNSLKLKNNILKYLRIKEADENLIKDIEECLDEIEKANSFKYIYRKYDEIFGFLNSEPYLSFLKDCDGFYLIAVTLGYEIENMIKYLSKTNTAKMIIMDAACSASLEYLADDYEKNLGSNLTYRFCPGYSKSDINDIKIIHQLLKAEKIGIEILDSCMMIPQKSMIGIVGIRKS